VDERLAGAFVFCGGVGSLRHLIRKGRTGFHSVYFYIPGMVARELDHPQLASALAPRPLLVCAATEDAGMPLEGVRAFEAAAREAYGDRGAQGRFRLMVEKGPHALTMKAFEMAADWLKQEVKVIPNLRYNIPKKAPVPVLGHA